MASLRARMAALMEASGGHAEPAPIGHAAALGPAMRVVSAAVAARPLSSVSPPPFDAAVGAAAVAGQQQTPGVPADTRDADDGDKATSAGEAQPQDVSVRALLSEEDLQFEGLSSKPWLRLIPKAVRQAVSAPQAGGSGAWDPVQCAARRRSGCVVQLCPRLGGLSASDRSSYNQMQAGLSIDRSSRPGLTIMHL